MKSTLLCLRYIAYYNCFYRNLTTEENRAQIYFPIYRGTIQPLVLLFGSCIVWELTLNARWENVNRLRVTLWINFDQFFQELVREELNEVFGDSERPCNLEDASKLKYLESCIKETLRLYPSVPHIKRYNSEDIVLSNGYKIPAGASYSIHIYSLHRNEEIFPDPLSFKPERFYSDQCSERHPFAFVPFSAGPRNCIGRLPNSCINSLFKIQF